MRDLLPLIFSKPARSDVWKCGLQDIVLLRITVQIEADGSGKVGNCVCEPILAGG
jgi:hypothetical protein